MQWETKCFYEYASMSNFLDWTEGQCNSDNPLAAFDKDVHFCYADYIHMHTLLSTQPHMLKVGCARYFTNVSGIYIYKIELNAIVRRENAPSNIILFLLKTILN